MERYEKVERVGRYLFSSGLFLSVIAYVFFIDFGLHVEGISPNQNMFLFTMGTIIALTALIGVASLRPKNLLNYVRAWSIIVFILFIVHLLTLHSGGGEFVQQEIIRRYRFIYASEIIGSILILGFSYIGSGAGMALGFSLLLLPWVIYYPDIVTSYRYLWSAINYEFPIPGTLCIGHAMFPLYLLVGLTTGTSALLLTLGAIYSAFLPGRVEKREIFFAFAATLLAVQSAFIALTLNKSVDWIRDLIAGFSHAGSEGQLWSLGLNASRIGAVASILMFIGALAAGVGNFGLAFEKEG